MLRRQVAVCLISIALPLASSWAQMVPVSALTVRHRFSATNLESPIGQLVKSADGTLYGVLATGGDNGGGAIFSFSAGTPQFTLVYSFGIGASPVTNSNGSLPNAPLVIGPDGSLYGTTQTGGDNASGTVFRLSPTGALTTIGPFGMVGEGQEPASGLYLANDGYLYGATYSGDRSLGTLFRVDAALAALQTVFAFPMDGSEGGESAASLIQAPDGTLYGTTRAGARPHFGNGGVFSLPIGGSATNLASFSGDLPVDMGALVRGADGAFYGLANLGGSLGVGFAYKITGDGVSTQLHAFRCNCGTPEGAYPVGTMILASSGMFYGVTNGGGVFNNGVIFRMTPEGTVTTLHSFTDSEGDAPVGGLVEGDDGRLYGMTSGAFTHNPTLFTLAFLPAAPVAVQSMPATAQVTLSWQSVKSAESYSVYQGQSPGAEATTAVLTQVGATSATITGLQASTTYYFKVTATNEAGESMPSAETSATPAASVPPAAPPSTGGGGGRLDLLSMLLLLGALGGRMGSGGSARPAIRGGRWASWAWSRGR